MFYLKFLSIAVTMSDDIELIFHNTILRKSDIQVLQGTEWITDSILCFYFEYLEKVVHINEHKLLFVRPGVAHCIQILDEKEAETFLDPLEIRNKELIFFPINDASENNDGTHWSLLVLSLLEKKFYYFDSIKKTNYESAEILKSKLSRYFEGNEKGTSRLYLI